MTDKELMTENAGLKETIKALYQEVDDVKTAAEEYRLTAEHLQERHNAGVYCRAVNHYGETSRLILAIEEMSELTKELSKHIRGRNNIPAICEEMADVEIMLEQLKIVFNNRAAVDYHKAHKLQRLADRMAGNND